MDQLSAEQLVQAVESRAPASLGPRRTSTTHEFYRYPARFTPQFARAAINAFTSPGDLVLDPFVGGGTTIVESRLTGRLGIGGDVNELAVFIARVKSRIYREDVLDEVEDWSHTVMSQVKLHVPPVAPDYWVENGYLRNVEGRDVWPIRKFISLIREEEAALQTRGARELARCGLLRTAQWALDMRSRIPPLDEFRTAFRANLEGMVDAARQFTRVARAMDRQVETDHPRRTLVVRRKAQDLADDERVRTYGPPRLVLTSPPYPGVYVNYHRWKLMSRLETPAPYWIAKCLDGQGLAHYTMSARVERGLRKYFAQLESAFSAVARLCNRETTLVQIVGFSEASSQLPRYLRAVSRAGFREVRFKRCMTADDGRLWRDVPGRQWWAHKNGGTTAQEVVLFHRLR